jgi:L-lactate dehydrogenase complex protein LldG
MAKGTIQNKDVFLKNIAGKLGRERKRDAALPEWKHHPQWEVYKGASRDELLTLFQRNSEEKKAEVQMTDQAGLKDSIEKIIKACGGGPVVTTKDDRFADFGLASLFENEDTHQWDTAAGPENIEKAETANLGVFFSDVSLAESGTVVQFNDKYIARSVSLLPTAYIAIVPASSIVPRMTQAMHRIHRQVEAGEDIATCINFISGPSNSADIEMNIVEGVHGPVKAVYLVVEDL